jgi:hypothetical protein
VVDFFGHDKRDGDVGFVEYLHDFLQFAVIAENVNGSLLEACFDHLNQKFAYINIKRAFTGGATIGGFDH